MKIKLLVLWYQSFCYIFIAKADYKYLIALFNFTLMKICSFLKARLILFGVKLDIKRKTSGLKSKNKHVDCAGTIKLVGC